MMRARTVLLWLMLLTLPIQGALAAAMLACQHHAQPAAMQSQRLAPDAADAAPPCHQAAPDNSAMHEADPATGHGGPCIDCAACACSILPPTVAVLTASGVPVAPDASNTPHPPAPPPSLPERPPRHDQA